MSNIVNLTARRREMAQEPPQPAVTADLRALHELQLLCARAVETGGLDAGGPTALDFTAAVHQAVKGTEWNVRFYRGQGSGE